MMKSNNRLNIAVIGGGASGLISAVFAADEAKRLKKNISITLFEANSRVGKKILVTGNGRCNLTNMNVSEENFHGARELAHKIYSRFDNESVVRFFSNAGLYTKKDFADRVYPLSSQANSVLDVLRFEVERAGVKVCTDCKISSVECSENGYLLNGQMLFDRIIIATGGKAAPVHGSDGSGFLLMKQLGVAVTDLYPALVPLVCKDFPKSLKGIRAQGKITLKSNGRLLSEDTGEIQYTEYGLSGIPAMQVSGAVSSVLKSGNQVFAFVDSCPSFSNEELTEILLKLQKERPSLSNEMLLAGLMPKKLGLSFLVDCSVNPLKNVGLLHRNVIERIVSSVKSKKYSVTGVRSFSDAQVTAGGISSDEIDSDTLGLKKYPGIFVCGEVVNVHGDCGGYNLQWAWSSGAVAGTNAVREK